MKLKNLIITKHMKNKHITVKLTETVFFNKKPEWKSKAKTLNEIDLINTIFFLNYSS